MWRGASTACIIYTLALTNAILLGAAANVFNNETEASTATMDRYDVDGILGDFNAEVDEAVSSLHSGEINLGVSNSQSNEDKDIQPAEFVRKGSNNTGEDQPTPNNGLMQLRNHNMQVNRQRTRGQNQRERARENKRNDVRKRRKKQGNRPNRGPRPRPSGSRPGNSRPSGQQSRPSANNVPQNNRPPARSPSPCFSVDMYKTLDRDIASIKNSIKSERERSHFLGGIVRLAAHDFMDFDRRSTQGGQMGADGCFDPSHDSNDGLGSIWSRGSPLYQLYQSKYSHLSRADFWVAAANAVIRQTSVGNALDLQDTFLWGRRDRDTCRGSGERLPEASRCGEVENVFLRNMGLEWKDAVALLGAHSLGRGSSEFSGHEGTWASSDRQAQVFDKSYYEAFFTEAWRPRNMGRGRQDWTTGRGEDHTRMMLNTDMCLVFDIDENIDRSIPCCTRTDSSYPNGQNQCVDMEAARRRCPMYSRMERRREATDAVRDMLGGSVSSNDNAPFYIAFAKAWRKATTVGQNNLFPLQDMC